MRRFLAATALVLLSGLPLRAANQTTIVLPATTIAFGAFGAGTTAPGPEFGGLTPFRRGFCMVNLTASSLAQTVRFIFQTAPDIDKAGASPAWTDYAATDQLASNTPGIVKVRFTAEGPPTQSNTSGLMAAGNAANGPFGGKMRVLAVAGANPLAGGITFSTTCLLQD